ncbi:MAG: VTT domain-containing protein [Acidobacteria bacterium]|nr:VTT domain-containing protein [Acidobacteriota bacterium]
MSYLLIAAATLVSEDLTCIAAGVMVARGEIGFLPATLACVTGIFAGDVLLYLAGRFLGRPALHRAPLRWLVSEAQVSAASRWFENRGARVVFATRFLPGLRLPTYVAAGVLHTRFAAFTGWFLLAAGLWTPMLVGGSAFLGERFLQAVGALRMGAGIPAFLAVLLIFFFVRLLFRLFSWRGRRLLLSSWRRATRWEFWPVWIFYLPVVAYVFRLGWEYRHLTVFTAANPAMPGGGFVGESKSDILADLARSGAPVAKFALLRRGSDLTTAMADGRTAGPIAPGTQAGAGDRAGRLLSQAREFMKREGLQFPIVLKPDVGQRGTGVQLLRSEVELAKALREARADCILQEWVDGVEFGIFYVRLLDEPRGFIFSVTEKRLPEVTGDGRSTLEQLILADPRAVCMARYFLGQHAARLTSVPAPGEKVTLTDVGNHCRGAMFLDGGWVKTSALGTQIDRIARDHPGFNFGRFDLRATSVEELRAGRGFKILELNGVSSEATDIYDPRNSLLAAYRKLFAQWRLAFAIGAAQHSLGVAPLRLGELLIMMTRQPHPALASTIPNPADSTGAGPA